jgi:hypothetical protein
MNITSPILTLHPLAKCLALFHQPTTNVEQELEDIDCEERTLLGHLAGVEREGVRRIREDELKNGVGERKTLTEIQHRKAQLGKPPSL